jgi:hypothetical protein
VEKSVWFLSHKISFKLPFLSDKRKTHLAKQKNLLNFSLRKTAKRSYWNLHVRVHLPIGMEQIGGRS